MSYYIKKCPKYGHQVFTVEICILPPIDYDQCYNCGWRSQERLQGIIIEEKDQEDFRNGRE